MAAAGAIESCRSAAARRRPDLWHRRCGVAAWRQTVDVVVTAEIAWYPGGRRSLTLFCAGVFTRSPFVNADHACLDPMSPVAHLDQAGAYLLARDYSRAPNQCDGMQAMGMNIPLARVYVAQTYQCMGKHEAAVNEMEEALALDGDAPAPALALLGHAYGLAGTTRAAREVQRQMTALASRCYDSPYDWAVLHTGLGEHGVALQYLEQALEERSPRVIWLDVEPAFDGLRADRRFQNLIRRLGLE